MPVVSALIAHEENEKCFQDCGLRLSRDRWWEGEKSSASRAARVSCAREESGICSSTPSCLLIHAPPPAPAVRPSVRPAGHAAQRQTRCPLCFCSCASEARGEFRELVCWMFGVSVEGPRASTPSRCLCDFGGAFLGFTTAPALFGVAAELAPAPACGAAWRSRFGAVPPMRSVHCSQLDQPQLIVLDFVVSQNRSFFFFCLCVSLLGPLQQRARLELVLADVQTLKQRGCWPGRSRDLEGCSKPWCLKPFPGETWMCQMGSDFRLVTSANSCVFLKMFCFLWAKMKLLEASALPHPAAVRSVGHRSPNANFGGKEQNPSGSI